MAVSFSLVKSGKCETIEDYYHLNEANEVPPRYGFNWWFWKPKVIFMPKNSLTVIEIKFMCYIFNISRW